MNPEIEKAAQREVDELWREVHARFGLVPDAPIRRTAGRPEPDKQGKSHRRTESPEQRVARLRANNPMCQGFLKASARSEQANTRVRVPSKLDVLLKRRY